MPQCSVGPLIIEKTCPRKLDHHCPDYLTPSFQQHDAGECRRSCRQIATLHVMHQNVQRGCCDPGSEIGVRYESRAPCAVRRLRAREAGERKADSNMTVLITAVSVRTNIPTYLVAGLSVSISSIICRPPLLQAIIISSPRTLLL